MTDGYIRIWKAIVIYLEGFSNIRVEKDRGEDCLSVTRDNACSLSMEDDWL
jgi:hypothetical protein